MISKNADCSKKLSSSRSANSGRTPGINASLGRDHFASAWSCSLSGMGIRGGVVHGATDAEGHTVKDGEASAADLFATILQALGIDHTHEYMVAIPPNTSCGFRKQTNPGSAGLRRRENATKRRIHSPGCHAVSHRGRRDCSRSTGHPFVPGKVTIDRTVRLPSITFCMARHQPSGRVFCGGADFGLHHFDPAAEKPEPKALSELRHNSYVTWLVSTGNLLISGGYDKSLIWWNAETGEQIRQHRRGPSHAGFAPSPSVPMAQNWPVSATT
ncbi:MAG UNVERIFIED_CONTAM: DUF1501 domain-containing protein [Planctomycetaceae bacterium]|jgi:hypothetical protein